LEGELKDCQAKLAVVEDLVEDRARHLESQQDGLHDEIASMAADLKASQAQCTCLQTNMASEKEKSETRITEVLTELTAVEWEARLKAMEEADAAQQLIKAMSNSCLSLVGELKVCQLYFGCHSGQSEGLGEAREWSS
jgi:hypothetical protein